MSRRDSFANLMCAQLAGGAAYAMAGVDPGQIDVAEVHGCFTISDVDSVEVEGTGELITYSVVNYGPEGFEDKAPYSVGVAKFAAGIKIFVAIGQDIKESDLKVGMAVKVVPARLPADKISYEFQAAN